MGDLCKTEMFLNRADTCVDYPRSEESIPPIDYTHGDVIWKHLDVKPV